MPQSAALTAEDDFGQRALGFAQRRVVIIAATLGGLCVTGPGLGWLLGSAVVGEPLEPGFITTGVGLILTGVAWLATFGARFTQKLPRPMHGSDKAVARSENRVLSGWTALTLVLLGCVAIALFTPRGKEPDVLAILPMVAAFPAVLLSGLLHIRRVVKDRNALYAGWLAKRPG